MKLGTIFALSFNQESTFKIRNKTFLIHCSLCVNGIRQGLNVSLKNEMVWYKNETKL
jgi:hypothetical protein